MNRWQPVQNLAVGLWAALSLWQDRHVARPTAFLAWVSWQVVQPACPRSLWAPRRDMALWQTVQLGLESLWGLWQDWQVPWVEPRALVAED